jgi:hypothetical protein
MRYYPGIRLAELRKTAKNFNQDSRCPGRDLNPGPPVTKQRSVSEVQWQLLKVSTERCLGSRCRQPFTPVPPVYRGTRFESRLFFLHTRCCVPARSLFVQVSLCLRFFFSVISVCDIFP